MLASSSLFPRYAVIVRNHNWLIDVQLGFIQSNYVRKVLLFKVMREIVQIGPQTSNIYMDNLKVLLIHYWVEWRAAFLFGVAWAFAEMFIEH